MFIWYIMKKPVSATLIGIAAVTTIMLLSRDKLKRVRFDHLHEAKNKTARATNRTCSVTFA